VTNEWYKYSLIFDLILIFPTVRAAALAQRCLSPSPSPYAPPATLPPPIISCSPLPLPSTSSSLPQLYLSLSSIGCIRCLGKSVSTWPAATAVLDFTFAKVFAMDRDRESG